jgi:YD repeat-containing protein
VYDGDGRQAQMIDPLGAVATTLYDNGGRVTASIDRDGREKDFSYDADNRVTQEVWKVSGTAVNTLTYSFDNDGRLLTAKNNAGTVTYGYDAQGRTTTQQDVFGLSLTFAYDGADRRTSVQDSLGGTLTSAYDAANRLTTREFGGASQTPLRFDLAYDNRNEVTTLAYYSDLAGTNVVGTTAYGYDDAGRVTAITLKNSSAATLSYYDYQYDGADRVTQESWSSTTATHTFSGTHTYAYDAASQLTAADGTVYSYDGTGNRTMAGYSTGTGNELSNDGTWTYTYDAEGDLTQKSMGASATTVYYAYDLNDRLTSVRVTSDGTTNVTTATYTYDAAGRLVQEDEWQTGGSVVTTRFAQDDTGQFWATVNTSNVVQRRYFRGDQVNDYVAQIDASNVLSWDLADRMLTVRDVVSSAGVVLTHEEYNAFGLIVSETDTTKAGNALFQGMWLDRPLVQYVTPNRVLNPLTDRWLQPDQTLFTAGDPNLYRVMGNHW